MLSNQQARSSTLVGGWQDEDGTRHRMRVEVAIKVTEGAHETVEHETVENPLRFTVCGVETYRTVGGRWLDGGGGQNRDDLLAVTEFADGWDAARRDELAALWHDWHLNDVQAGCVHQTVEYERDRYGRTVPSLDKTRPCPVTGYKYGHAWLTKIIPDDVLARMRTFLP